MKLFISAGGTGGHIFPGLAVAEAFTSGHPENEVVFIGTPQGLEGRLIPRTGYRLLFINARQFMGRSIAHKAATLIYLVYGICKAMAIMRKEKPDAILGMGGFTSVPTILAGVLMRVPAFVHEQNIEPGMANRFLARLVASTFISFEESRHYLKAKKIYHTGNPLRKTLKTHGAKKSEGAFGIFIFGGSRGAHSINEAILSLLPYLECHPNTVIYHQTGTDDFERIKETYRAIALRYEVFPFTDEMEKYYSLADVVISRAGATTIFELAYFRKAAILIPYPFSAGNHQWKNASYLESVGGAYLVGNEEATGVRLYEVLKHLMAEPELLYEMGDNIGKIYIDSAAERIIKIMEGEIVRR